MDSPISSTFAAVPFRAKLAFYTAIVFALLLVLAGNGYAATPSNASLSGEYVFHITTTKEAYWSASKTCGTGTKKYTAFVDQQTAYTQLIYGVATFDGAGHATFAFTRENQFNQSASDAGIVITCTGNGTWTTSGGNPVFEAPSSGTATGTYKVEATGTSSMTIDVPSQPAVTFDIDIAGVGTNNIASTMLLRSVISSADNELETGIAVHK